LLSHGRKSSLKFASQASQPSRRLSFSALAATARLEVVGSITKNLAFVCAGENAGPSKLEKAKEQGVHVLNREQFEHLLETGEILDV
jgi:BRCT domain type II-containing protein